MKMRMSRRGLINRAEFVILEDEARPEVQRGRRDGKMCRRARRGRSTFVSVFKNKRREESGRRRSLARSLAREKRSENLKKFERGATGRVLC